MNRPTLSSSWYRVAAIRPRLLTRAKLYRHRYRGQVWHLLQDPASRGVHRFTPGARLVLAAMDGQRTVEDLWERAIERLGDEAPTQDDMIQLLGQLHAADLLQTDVPPDALELFERGQRTATQRRRLSWTNPMAVRIPLWDPGKLLDRIHPWTRRIWSRWGAVAWLVAVLPALLMLPAHWPELTHNLSDRVLQAGNLLLLTLVFTVIKVLHEFGHATATRAGGGEVHDMGVMLLVLMPVPYVEASASSVFPSKYRRALVGLAGMAVELFIAALALYLWLLVEPGVVRSTAFNIMLVAGVSTLLFNGNPLLRYDAYYVLSDLIGIPNLAQRSLKYWGYLLERYVMGVRDAEPPLASPSERAWFCFYGLASTLYRAAVTIGIALFIAKKFFIVGVLLALWSLSTMLLLPVYKSLRYMISSPQIRRRRMRVWGMIAPALVLLLLGIIAVPLPSRSQAEGVIWPPEQAIVHAGANGFFEAFVAQPGKPVAKGDLLIRSGDPALDAEIRSGEARVAELEASYAVEFSSDRAKAEIVREKLLGERAALLRTRERADALLVRSGSDGVFTVQQAEDMPGRYHKKGDVLGYVMIAGPAHARVVVNQAEVDGVARSGDEVALRMVHAPERVLKGRVVRQVPEGDQRLPSLVLSLQGGGRVAVDPRDPQGLRTLERMFQLDVEIESDALPILYGQRVHVRFAHPPQPLGVRFYRAMRRLFLTHFNV